MVHVPPNLSSKHNGFCRLSGIDIHIVYIIPTGYSRRHSPGWGHLVLTCWRRPHTARTSPGDQSPLIPRRSYITQDVCRQPAPVTTSGIRGLTTHSYPAPPPPRPPDPCDSSTRRFSPPVRPSERHFRWPLPVSG